MLGFTMSKLNILILVTAMFAIIAYFMFGLTDLVISHNAQLLIDAYSESVLGVVHSDKLCFKIYRTVPDSITYFGSQQLGQRFFYVMKISSQESSDSEKPNTLIMSIASRKLPDKLIAAKSIDINAEIIFYDWDLETSILERSESIILDPEASDISYRRKNSLVIVKEVRLGQKYLYIIACSDTGGICEANAGDAGCCIKQDRGGVESACIRANPDCDSASIMC